ncbi:MAG: c-type cytochrome [Solirubrobacterales bacterium]
MIFRALALALPVLTLASGVALAQAAGDAEAGEKVFNQCKACHTIEEGKNRVGPSLFGVIGRKSGSVAGFNYSDAMKKADITWTPENLDKYLTDPKAFVPGNKMAFAGLKSPQDRQNVIAYLEHKGKKD